MAYKELTAEGKRFINKVAAYQTANGKYGNQSMLKGNNGALPFSSFKNDPDKVWTANVAGVNNNDDMALYLIEKYDDYAERSGVDANIMAAQAYKESTYKIWNYVRRGSTASGVAQILMDTMYSLIYLKKWLTDDEKAKIIKDMVDPKRASSWIGAEKQDFVNSSKYILRQETNRSFLHQNMIDNPDICIKLQCALMEYIAANNANLASSSLFAYNTGSERISNNMLI